jgi:hypothetical protein
MMWRCFGVRRARIAIVAVVCAAAMLGAACGGDDDDTTTDTTEANEGPTTTTQADLEAEIVAAYEQSWRDFIRAGDPPDPDAEFLTDHNTGEALTAGRNLLEQYAAEGVVVEGSYEFDAEVVELGDGTAVVEDCGLNQTRGVLAETGEVVDTSDDERDGLMADMVLEDEAWKVSSLTNDAEVCAGA